MSSAGDYRKQVKPGDELNIPAQAWNRIQRSADYTEAQQSSTSAERPGGLPEGLIKVKNLSGAARNRFDVLGIDKVLIEPHDRLSEIQNRPALAGVKPETAKHAGKFVVLQQPLDNEKVGWAWLFGYCAVKVNIASLSETVADVKDSDYGQLQAGGGNAQIVYIDPKDTSGATTTTGTHWCLVRLGGAGGGGGLTAGEFFGQVPFSLDNVAVWLLDVYVPQLPS